MAKAIKTCTCVICSKRMNNYDYSGNQPQGGTEFITYGHYGSAVTDTMDGIGFAINICDGCLRAAGDAGHVLRIFPPRAQPRPKPTYRRWRR